MMFAFRGKLAKFSPNSEVKAQKSSECTLSGFTEAKFPQNYKPLH